MAKELLKDIQIGDMLLRYEIETQYNRPGLYIIPASMKDEDVTDKKNSKVNNICQYKIAGDIYADAFGHGSTMRNGESANRLDYVSQDIVEESDKTIITTHLKDSRGYEVDHIVTYYKGEYSFEMRNEITNMSEEPITLEMISSFELGNITPFVAGDSPDSLLVHRIKSKWSHEGRLCTETVEDLQLEPTWSTWAVGVERYGQTGSMPVNKYFPFVGVEDAKNDVLWGAMLAHEASWQMEIYRQDDGLHISGGLADREFGHWMKVLKTGEKLVTPTAIVTVFKNDESTGAKGIDTLGYRLTQAMQKYADKAPISEQSLPILFNEYCTTWGCPSHENISGILNAIKDKGFEYFVIDCGWFKREGISWGISMGDYDVSKELFPGGLEETVAAIKEAGLKPGIWFEIDLVGPAAYAYEKHKDHMLKRDGHVITTYGRRFWDMTDPWVEEYLTEKVIGTLNKYGFEYMKMDYNDTIGIGCDGFDSLGEGLRQNMEASVKFVKKVLKEVPGIILENCSSGGHKLEPLMMSITSMASFSDAHETEEIPIIAANLHRTILPRQSQIWAVIRKHDSVKRIAYSIANTFLGRMCLSGDVTELSDAQWEAVDNGMAFYKKIAEIIKYGFTYRYGTHITSERHPKGWQGVVRVGDNGEAYALIHTFNGEWPEKIEIKLPKNCPTNIEALYSDNEFKAEISNGVLSVYPDADMKAMAVYLK